MMFLLVLKLALVVAVVATAAADGDNNNTSSRVLSRKHSLPEKKNESSYIPYLCTNTM